MSSYIGVYTKKQWDAGYIPQACKDLAKDTKTAPKDFEVWDVTYEDVCYTLPFPFPNEVDREEGGKGYTYTFH